MSDRLEKLQAKMDKAQAMMEIEEKISALVNQRKELAAELTGLRAELDAYRTKRVAKEEKIATAVVVAAKRKPGRPPKSNGVQARA